jgi:heptosyltransferase-2
MLTTELGAKVYNHDPELKAVITWNKRGPFGGLRQLLDGAAVLKAKRFDRVYSVHRSFRTALLLLLAGIPERIGFTAAAGKMMYTRSLSYAPNSQHYVQRQLSIFGEDPQQFSGELRLPALGLSELQGLETSLQLDAGYALLLPGSVWQTKMWHWSNFLELARMLKERGFQIVLAGASSEQKVNAKIAESVEVLDLTGKTSIPGLFALIRQAALVVCNDSAALHVASAYRRPTVAVFCATAPEFGFGPWRNPLAETVAKAGLYCRPCRRHGSRSCPNGTELCMRQLSAQEVFDATERVLKRAATYRAGLGNVQEEAWTLRA